MSTPTKLEALKDFAQRMAEISREAELAEKLLARVGLTQATSEGWPDELKMHVQRIRGASNAAMTEAWKRIQGGGL